MNSTAAGNGLLETEPEFRVLRTIQLGEVTLATPALTDGAIIFRTTGHLIAVSGD